MSNLDSPLERLWKEYSAVFCDFDDLTLGRWLAQTLGQLQGRAWRLSHPLVGAYRLGAQLAHERQIWFKRMATPPAAYGIASCCRAPLLPLFTRDVAENGLICQHCGETCQEFEDMAADLRTPVGDWANAYGTLHAVAHWDDQRRLEVADYDKALDNAADEVEKLLFVAGAELVPKFLDHFAAVVWEDQDECLEIRPEDIEL
jgi:hypothetical protein